jgi:hypothetical protein
MNLEQWAILLTVAVAAVPWAFSVHAKLAAIAEAVKAIPNLWLKVDEHTDILQGHAIDLARLKERKATSN